MDATDALVMPALTVSVRALKARAWLTAPTLDRFAALGVGTVRWHVDRDDRGEAEQHVRSMAAAGRPAVAVVDEADETGLVVTKAPPDPGAPTLGAALAALLGARGAVADGVVARALSGPALPGPRTPALAPDAAASLLLLRPAPSAPAGGPETLRIEGIWIDGRPVHRSPSAAP